MKTAGFSASIMLVAALCAGVLLLKPGQLVVPFLAASGCGFLLLYLVNPWLRGFLVLSYALAAVLHAPLFILFPFPCMIAARGAQRYWILGGLVPLVLFGRSYGIAAAGCVAALCSVAGLIGILLSRLDVLQERHLRLRDNFRQMQKTLEWQKRQLLAEQDASLQAAMLEERNRIARDIHDNVGHLLSSALLQIAALRCQDGNPQEALEDLSATLDSAMDSIRRNVHSLHDSAVDIKSGFNTLLNDFRFCATEVGIDYEHEPSMAIRYALIAIVREALTNTARHSRATLFRLHFREHPGLYQLFLSDNGDNGSMKTDRRSVGSTGTGMGLQAIEDRVIGLGGHIRINMNKGCSIFISIPKDKE